MKPLSRKIPFIEAKPLTRLLCSMCTFYEAARVSMRHTPPDSMPTPSVWPSIQAQHVQREGRVKLPASFPLLLPEWVE